MRVQRTTQKLIKRLVATCNEGNENQNCARFGTVREPNKFYRYYIIDIYKETIVDQFDTSVDYCNKRHCLSPNVFVFAYKCKISSLFAIEKKLKFKLRWLDTKSETHQEILFGFEHNLKRMDMKDDNLIGLIVNLD